MLFLFFWRSCPYRQAKSDLKANGFCHYNIIIEYFVNIPSIPSSFPQKQETPRYSFYFFVQTNISAPNIRNNHKIEKQKEGKTKIRRQHHEN